MNAEELKKRTKQFGLRVIQLTDSLPSKRSAGVIGGQLMRSGTSVGANYRAACRARSKPEFISKASISIEEADESLYWMEMLIESGLVQEVKLSSLMKEGDEIVAILTASVITARANLNRSRQ